MKSLLKYLGVILVIIGAAVMIGCFATGNVNSNSVLGLATVLIILGLIVYIILNKRITD